MMRGYAALLACMLASASAFALDESVMCTAEYAPVCGEIPRMCVTAPCESPRETFGNACMAHAAGAIEVTPGECRGVDEGEDSFPPFDWARQSGLTSALTLEDFAPSTLVTRQEAAKFFSVAHPLIRDLSAVIYPDRCDQVFADGDQIDPSLGSSVQDVCRIGLMKGYRGFFRPTDLLTRSELSLLIERLSVDTSDIRMPQGIHVERSELIELLYLMAQKYQATQITSGELEGVWNLESTTLSGADISKVRSRTVTFEGGRFTHQICNRTSGVYAIEGGVIKTSGVMATQMYCLESADIESVFDLDGATFSRIAVKRAEGSSGPSEYLTITTRSGVEFVLSR